MRLLHISRAGILCTEGGARSVGDRSSCHLTLPSLGTWMPEENGGTKGTCAGGSVGGGLVSGVAQLPWPVRSQGVGEGRERSLFLLSGGDGDQLLGGLGDVIGALDHLLGQQLEVHRRARFWRHCLPALTLQPVGAGVEQPQ